MLYSYLPRLFPRLLLNLVRDGRGTGRERGERGETERRQRGETERGEREIYIYEEREREVFICQTDKTSSQAIKKYKKEVVRNRKLYNEIQELKGTSLSFPFFSDLANANSRKHPGILPRAPSIPRRGREKRRERRQLPRREHHASQQPADQPKEVIRIREDLQS